MLVDTRQKKYRSSLILERYFLCIYTSIAETPTIEILQFLHYHPLANKVEIMAGLTEAPSDSTADGKKHILFGKRYEFARKRNKTNFAVVNNVYLHKINEKKCGNP